MVCQTVPTNLVLNPQQVETSSTSDSLAEVHLSEGLHSPSESQEAFWCVTLPSEAVLLFDSLHDFLHGFGKVITVTDINE